MKFTLKELLQKGIISTNHYTLFLNILTNFHKQSNILVISTSNTKRSEFLNALILLYKLPVILVQDSQRLYTQSSLTFNYKEVDYPQIKLLKKIQGYRCIIADCIPNHPVTMHILNAINLYQIGIVSIDKNDIHSAFEYLYNIHVPLKKFKDTSSKITTCYINDLFDFIVVWSDELSIFVNNRIHLEKNMEISHLIKI